MIFFDTTKTGSAGHRSGLTRVSSRLLEHLGPAATAVRWTEWDRRTEKTDWFFTVELFSEEERPGFTAFLDQRSCRCAAVFHDAIPLKHPHITWPQSVARHPEYMKLLARFDRIFAVSRASRDELLGFWQWQGLEQTPPVDVLALGANHDDSQRVTIASGQQSAVSNQLLCVGILEPRKNQAFLMEVCAELWREGLAFELHLVGRVNPHFGAPIVARVKELRREFPAQMHYHEAASDATVAQLYASARATAFPTIAEGCGLPLLESLWRGVPVICSDLPVLRENADGGGCLPAAPNDRAAWKAALRRIFSEPTLQTRLATEARTRTLPTWRETAEAVRRALS